MMCNTQKKNIMEREVKISIWLKHPFGVAIMELEKLVSIWGLRIWSAATYLQKAEILIKISTFEIMFGYRPKKGPMNVPDTLSYFIQEMLITDIK